MYCFFSPKSGNHLETPFGGSGEPTLGAPRRTSLAKAAACPGPSPELSLLAEVVEALAQLVDLGLLALQVRAVLLEAAGQQAGALLGCLQVLLHLTEEGLLGLQLGGHGLQGGEADSRHCGQSFWGPGARGFLLWGVGRSLGMGRHWGFASEFLLKSGGHFCRVPLGY